MNDTIDSTEVRAALATAFRELRPRLIEIADANARLDPQSRRDEFTDADIEQVLNAYEMLFLEAVEGTGREKRDLVFETALPPILEMQSALDMVRGNVAFGVLLTARLVPLVAEELREEATLWLAGFLSEYSRELAERALAIEQGMSR